MSLQSLHLSPIMDNAATNLVAAFYEPALSVSVRYDRGVGFFSSGWLRMVANGMVQFAANGGQARILTSPILQQADWEAMQQGDDARTNEILRCAMQQNI